MKRLVLAQMAFLLASSVNAADSLIPKIDELVAKTLADEGVPSYAVGIIKDGKPLLAKGYGLADVEHQVPATEKTVYRIGSLTKSFTAMAVMQLAGQGKLTVTDEITKLLPDLPTHWNKVTLQHLLQHTSGLQSYTDLPEFYLKARLDLSHDELIMLFRDRPFHFKPGERRRYCNSGYYLLGMAIEKASGRSYAEYVREHIFKPLDMRSSRYGGHRAVIPHRARGYASQNGEIVNAEFVSMSPPGAAGALLSNVEDLLKWIEALDAERFLSPEAYEEMYTPTHLADGTTYPYAYGWGLGFREDHRMISHYGGINGFRSKLTLYPSDRLGIVVLSNYEKSHPVRLERRIANLVLGIGSNDLDLPVDEKTLAKNPGRYEAEDKTRWFEVTIHEGRVVGKTAQQEYQMMWQGGLRFIARPDGFRLVFTFEEKDGHVDSLTIGQTVLQRVKTESVQGSGESTGIPGKEKSTNKSQR